MDNVSKQNCHVGLHYTHTAPYLWILDKFEYLEEVPNAAINSYVLQEDFQQTLTIPTSDIKLYFANIDRLGDLENVLFFLDEVLSYSPGELSRYSYHNDKDIHKRDTIVKMAKEHEEEIMWDLICFIKEHNRRSDTSKMWQFEFLRLLPTLRLPTSINTLNWVQFAANVPSTDLTCVQEISLPKNNGFAYDQLCGERHFSSAVALLGEDGRSLLARHGLVPLEEVNITESPAAPLTDEMDDIFIAPTMEDHYGEQDNIDSGDGGDVVDNHQEPTTIGQLPLLQQRRWRWDWNMPQLRTLALTSEFALRFELQMLKQCPVLQCLELPMNNSAGHSRTLTRANHFELSDVVTSGPSTTKQRRQGPSRKKNLCPGTGWWRRN
ncbi:hypothetical protein BGX24_010177 [Mortierella sp. AD032]|nr:hypothetical protein BGX24_010177 [Mortierella sp. AD032]